MSAAASPELTPPIPPAAPPAPASPRSRRALLGGLLGAAGAFVAARLGRPDSVSAAAGDPLILGTTNYAGSSATRLSATSSGGAFWMTQNGSGSGVRGDSVNGTGGVFLTHHPDRYGLLAQQTGTTHSNIGAAVYADGGQSTGVWAVSAASTAIYASGAPGVWGTSDSYYGVYGTSTSNTGVVGNSGSGVGVYGSSNSYFGVFGSSVSSYGVYGSSDSSYAGYFYGNVNVTGNISAASANASIKAFRIDHPLDPANKVLMHSCVESNERLTVYAGTVTTDAKGEATISLPDWFSALNTDLRYQLTTIGDARAWIAAEVKANRFTIASDKPGIKVCWQVTGVREDAYAKAHPLEVESKKTGREKGRYLNPVDHGQPDSKGIDYEERQKAQQKPALPTPPPTP
jgi:hypothetical protein